jgi:tuberculosinol/isotuberculosinol synthase
MLEYPPQEDVDPLQSYMDITGQHHVRLYRMLFDHGIDTLLTPVFGSELSEARGDDYVLRIGAEGLRRLAEHPDFLNFYHEYQVRVRFYGDYRKFFKNTPYTFLFDSFEAVTAQTQHYDRFRLFFGVCANDATETVAELGIRHYAEHGALPDKQKLIEMYYGEPVSPVSLFIGFDKFSAFDMPLLALGQEDLYFTVSPSLYLTEPQLRAILFDHLFTRRAEEPDYSTFTAEDWMCMKQFYQANKGQTMGIGAIQPHGSYWYPLPQVVLPDGFKQENNDGI